MIKLRRFKQNDIDAIHKLLNDTIDKSYKDFYPKEAIEYFKKHHNKDDILKDANDGYCIIALYNGIIVGVGILLGTNIRRVFIDWNYQKLGIGSRIMKKLEAKASKDNIDEVDLSSSLPSKDFYLKHGYINEGEKSIDVGNNEKLEYFEMKKSILTKKALKHSKLAITAGIISLSGAVPFICLIVFSGTATWVFDKATLFYFLDFAIYWLNIAFVIAIILSIIDLKKPNRARRIPGIILIVYGAIICIITISTFISIKNAL